MGKIEDIDERMDQMILSPAVWHYRNKMEYLFPAIRFDLETQTVIDDFAQALNIAELGGW